MLRVGIVGIGFMGWIHYLAYRKLPGVQLAAICTRNEQRLAGDWRGIQGNFGPPGEQIDVSSLARYRTLEALLADDSIDVVDLCLPPDVHADAAEKCLAAGKHVLVEKPMALTVAEAERMLSAAARAGKQLLVAHVLPFFPEFAYAYDLIQSGKYGAFRGGTFKRTISDPTWIPDFFDAAKTGGPVVDLHIHDAHFIRLVGGMPSAVYSRGRCRGEVVEYLSTQFIFPDPAVQVVAIGGVIPQQGRPFTHGFEIHLEQATLIFDMQVLVGQTDHTGIPLTILKPDGTTERPALGSGDPVDAFVLELAEAIRAAESNTPSPLLSSELARDALVICERETQSVKTGELVTV